MHVRTSQHCLGRSPKTSISPASLLSCLPVYVMLAGFVCKNILPRFSSHPNYVTINIRQTTTCLSSIGIASLRDPSGHGSHLRHAIRIRTSTAVNSGRIEGRLNARVSPSPGGGLPSGSPSASRTGYAFSRGCSERPFVPTGKIPCAFGIAARLQIPWCDLPG